jgi:farnesyl diphosphate synthase
VYIILRSFFRAEPELYLQLSELLREVIWITELGQQLDLTSTQAETVAVDFRSLSEKRYRRTILLKTAWYSFYLPVALALMLAGKATPSALEWTKRILIPTGELFQIQDDVIDCFGDPSFTGKVGTDIQDGKCTWLAVTALQSAAPEQIDELAANYGAKDDAKVARVKEIYLAIGLQDKFAELERATCATIEADTEQAVRETGLPRIVFSFLLDQIRGRKK